MADKMRVPSIACQGIRALRRHHKPDADRDDSWINIEEVEERLLVGKQRHDDLFKLAAYYVTVRGAHTQLPLYP